jgi:coenzyme F420-reducing hydrogenase alpha subunit
MTHRSRDLQVSDVQLRIYEPPRFFEAFLRGRQHTEVSDITSRICGICPVAYQASAWQAIESICGIEPGEPISALRRLLYCGEWISSHALHIYMLHAPDFLGYPDVVALARDHRAIVGTRIAAQEGGQRRARGDRRARDPPRQHPGRRLLPCSAPDRADVSC